MKSLACIAVHASQFPETVRRQLRESLRTRCVNQKFLYDGISQSQKWMALHKAFSPWHTDPNCVAIYKRACAAGARQIKSRRVHVVGLGCGGGHKDALLLRMLKARHRKVTYTPCDVSVGLVLTARRSALQVIPEEDCHPLVCDLGNANDLPNILDLLLTPRAPRLITFFGMLPNLESNSILPKLGRLIGQDDLLLLSANLIPGPDYAAGMKKILPQYDNALMRNWLRGFLLDLGFGRRAGQITIGIADGTAGLKRIEAQFHFTRQCRIEIDGSQFRFNPGEKLSLFFSYRHTPELVRRLLKKHDIEVLDQWTTNSQEEGVFLCKRRFSPATGDATAQKRKMLKNFRLL